ncbi:hypothetical protein PTSG_05869 [Salpingoeca rosetta]|uniref:Myotubularin phosphatase domain-containing protein n=1 Tax=Salpingoeca rosetta (strain ATCC 50818 / BSB-021) TaxID=946362 RepID=F2UD10_SALR5|nr:uncharacterized protein PTSG_05869 [Salpingoeca rosetta]EGD74505.1 hypothetical protein PTSG_05869 [Salpingoeca rosetta]|eukprot:XP_004992762.1 hypothetical protein PTSG_05869 [Salpingoeca rosetta]
MATQTNEEALSHLEQPPPPPQVAPPQQQQHEEHEEELSFHTILQGILVHFMLGDLDRNAPFLQQVSTKCRELLAKDYIVEDLDNSDGHLCPHYPHTIFFLADDRNSSSDSDAATTTTTTTNTTANNSSGNINDDNTNRSNSDDEEEGDDASTAASQRAANLKKLQRLIRKAQYARCRRRFPVPVIRAFNKHICRSATLSTYEEIMFRLGVSSVYAYASKYFSDSITPAATDFEHTDVDDDDDDGDGDGDDDCGEQAHLGQDDVRACVGGSGLRGCTAIDAHEGMAASTDEQQQYDDQQQNGGNSRAQGDALTSASTAAATSEVHSHNNGSNSNSSSSSSSGTGSVPSTEAPTERGDGVDVDGAEVVATLHQHLTTTTVHDVHIGLKRRADEQNTTAIEDGENNDTTCTGNALAGDDDHDHDGGDHDDDVVVVDGSAHRGDGAAVADREQRELMANMAAIVHESEEEDEEEAVIVRHTSTSSESGSITPRGFSSATSGAQTPNKKPESARVVSQHRSADIQLLDALNVKWIFDLMVENRKLKYRYYVSSSEKADAERRYDRFSIVAVPYPGVEDFAHCEADEFDAFGKRIDWTNPRFDADVSIPYQPSAINIDYEQYRTWNLGEITANYMKLLVHLIATGTGEGLLLHCISGWDRTPLFTSLLRLSLWADGVSHASLSAEEALYLTVAYDWVLFGHQLSTRLSKHEAIFFFCFDFLQHLADAEYACPGATVDASERHARLLRVRELFIASYRSARTKHEEVLKQQRWFPMGWLSGILSSITTSKQ